MKPKPRMIPHIRYASKLLSSLPSIQHSRFFLQKHNPKIQSYSYQTFPKYSNTYIHLPTKTMATIKNKKQPPPLLPISLPHPPPPSSSTMLLARGGEIEELQSSSCVTKPLLYSTISNPSSSSNDEKKKTYLSNGKQQKRRRRGSSDGSGGSLVVDRQHSVEHAASETYLITRLGFQLLRYLGLGYRWVLRFLALGCYAVLLMPGFLQVGYFYYTSRQIKRSIVYGDQPRNKLDLYLPKDNSGPKPVVAFVTGGAWIIGYKAWGTVLGLQLADKDIIVACIDYRNFPQATIGDMVKDASQGIAFVCNNIAEYGGDPNRIYIMGQSAGAHIASCAVIEQAIRECGERESGSWSVSQTKAYFGLSGGYNLPNLVEHFHGRGLNRSLFLSIMEGDQTMRQYSPELRVQDPSFQSAVSLLPTFVLFHGTADYSIPSDSSKHFADALESVGAKAELVLYEGKSHTDLFVQDALRGGTDKLVDDIVSFIYAGDEVALAKAAVSPPRRRLVPEFLLKLARKISPF